MPYSGSFRQEFKKTIVIFEISTIEFVKTQKPKLSYLGSFGLEIYKAIVIFEISTAQFIKNKF